MHEAAHRGYIEVVKVLLALNAPVNPRTMNNDVPWQLARTAGHRDCADLLERYEGPVPKTHRSLWYHGTLGRNEAVELIQQSGNRDGSYLVRFSDRNGGCFALTMLHDQQTFHFLIRKEVRFTQNLLFFSMLVIKNFFLYVQVVSRIFPIIEILETIANME